MRVMEGSSFIGKGERWYKLEVDVDTSDFNALLLEWGFSETAVPTHIKYVTLTLVAQQLLAYRVYEAGGYSLDEYKFVIEAVMKKLATLKDKVRAESILQYGETETK